MEQVCHLQGSVLDRQVPSWAEQVADISRTQPYLLEHTPDQLRAVHAAGLVHVAALSDVVIGCAVLWPLEVMSHDAPWHEIGTVFVDARFRHAVRPDLEVADKMYRHILAATHLNILATTANPAAVRLGLRVGLKHVAFGALPEEVRRATCICPSRKTLSLTPENCLLRGTQCVVRISSETWERLGRPPVADFPPALIPPRRLVRLGTLLALASLAGVLI